MAVVVAPAPVAAFGQALALGHRYAILPAELVPAAGVEALVLAAQAMGRCGEVRSCPEAALAEVCLVPDADCLASRVGHGWPGEHGYAAGMLREQVDPVARIRRRVAWAAAHPVLSRRGPLRPERPS